MRTLWSRAQGGRCAVCTSAPWQYPGSGGVYGFWRLSVDKSCCKPSRLCCIRGTVCYACLRPVEVLSTDRLLPPSKSIHGMSISEWTASAIKFLQFDADRSSDGFNTATPRQEAKFVIIKCPASGDARRTAYQLEEGKKALIHQVAQGRSIKDALTVIDRTRNTYERWRKEDRFFAQLVDSARLGGAQDIEREHLSFPEFSAKYLEAEVFPHTQNIVDLIDGKDPTGSTRP